MKKKDKYKPSGYNNSSGSARNLVDSPLKDSSNEDVEPTQPVIKASSSKKTKKTGRRTK